jgi:hypothetical protein
MSVLPEDFTDRVKYVQRFYNKLVKENPSWNLTKIYAEVAKQLEINEKSVRRYKTEWENTKTVKVSRVQIEKEKPIIKFIKVGEKVSKQRKRTAILEICNELSKGEIMLTRILDEHGLTRYTFNEWINEDEEYLVVFDKAQEMHNQAYGHRLDEAIRRMILVYVGDEQQQERRVTYTYNATINPENPEEIIYEKIPTSETITYRPIKPEPIMVKQIMESVRDFKSALAEKENHDIKGLLGMSESQLNEQILLLESKRTKPDK